MHSSGWVSLEDMSRAAIHATFFCSAALLPCQIACSTSGDKGAPSNGLNSNVETQIADLLTNLSQVVLTKFGLPKETHVDLKDSSGIDVNSDIFDELVKSSQVSFVVSTEESSGTATAVD
ncbi:hypothetical protein SRHO_G00280000 [Serrasalmus rhombeus]